MQTNTHQTSTDWALAVLAWEGYEVERKHNRWWVSRPGFCFLATHDELKTFAEQEAAR